MENRQERERERATGVTLQEPRFLPAIGMRALIGSGWHEVFIVFGRTGTDLPSSEVLCHPQQPNEICAAPQPGDWHTKHGFRGYSPVWDGTSIERVSLSLWFSVTDLWVCCLEWL